MGGVGAAVRRDVREDALLLFFEDATFDAFELRPLFFDPLVVDDEFLLFFEFPPFEDLELDDFDDFEFFDLEDLEDFEVWVVLAFFLASASLAGILTAATAHKAATI